jgi:uncharacterized protein (DUF433 family)
MECPKELPSKRREASLMSTHLIEHREGARGKTAYIGETRVRVSDIARIYETLQLEFITERILEAIPHLTEEQVVAALRYWQANREEINRELVRDEEVADSLRSSV